MEKEFVPYDRALKLKALGFDEPCFKCKVIGQEHLDYTPSDYDNFPEQKEVEVLTPTFSQAFRWFREKGYDFNIVKELSDDLVTRVYVYWCGYLGVGIDRSEEYKTYEEAELACLDKLIEIV